MSKRNKRALTEDEWVKWISEDDIAHSARNRKNSRKIKRSKPKRSREYD
jgi:hypothetical protein